MRLSLFFFLSFYFVISSSFAATVTIDRPSSDKLVGLTVIERSIDNRGNLLALDTNGNVRLIVMAASHEFAYQNSSGSYRSNLIPLNAISYNNLLNLVRRISVDCPAEIELNTETFDIKAKERSS